MIKASATANRDQEVADLQHRLLGMAGGPGAGDELGGAAEKRVRAGRDDHAAHLALFDDAAGIGLRAELLGDRKRLAGQRGLIGENVAFPDQAKVGGNDRAEADVDDISRHQGRRVDCLDLAVAQRRRLEREAFLQRGQRIRGFPVLPDFEAGVEHQQSGNDDKIVPAAEHGRYDRGCLDHVGDRGGEMVQELLSEAHLLFRQGVGPVLGEPLADGVCGEALIRRHLETREHLINRDGREIVGPAGRR
jgi:hypothetical protein